MREAGKALAVLCAAALALCLAGCAQQESPSAPSAATATPAPTASPAATPTPTDPEPDGDPYDESDYYFDFGQDDRIRLDYAVTWPKDQMPGWTEVESDRVAALLTLEGEGGTITVLLEDAPESPDLSAFVETARELLTFNYEGVALEDGVQAGDYLLVRGSLPDGGIVESAYRQVDGLYLTAELRADAQAAGNAESVFTSVFLPGLQLTRDATED